ncbi:MAG: metallophosphoesterase [Myxococcota bacterium]
MGRTLTFLVFISVLSSVVVGGHVYLWMRWVRDTELASPWNRIVTTGIVLAGLAMISAPLLYRVFAGARTLVVPAYVWFGTAFYAALLLFAADLAKLVFDVAQKASEAPVVPARRLAVIRALSGSAALGSVLLAAGAVRAATQVPGVKRVHIQIPGLPEAFRGFRIVQLSDIHVGPTIDGDFVSGVVETVNGLKPDLVAITGDLVDGGVRELGDAVAPLAELRAPDGVYFTTGNHEYYSGVGPWMDFLPTLGVTVLRNTRVWIERDASRIALAGVDDHTAAGFGGGHGADYSAALGGLDEKETVILMAHQPKQIEAATTLGVDLVLSGHTHGGQLWPFGVLVRLAQPYVSGLHRHDDRAQIYVSRGTGFWGPPMRVGAPAEITEIVLG